MASRVNSTEAMIATSLISVGEEEKRESTVMWNERPDGTAPFRSVKTPTTCGRRSPSSCPSTGTVTSSRPPSAVVFSTLWFRPSNLA